MEMVDAENPPSRICETWLVQDLEWLMAFRILQNEEHVDTLDEEQKARHDKAMKVRSRKHEQRLRDLHLSPEEREDRKRRFQQVQQRLRSARSDV